MALDVPTAQLLSAPLGGALAVSGALTAQWLLIAQSRRSERRALAGAFAGELAALIAIMGQRRYLEQIDALIANVEASGRVPRLVFTVRHHYFRVFDANAARLGVLAPPLPELLAHHYIYSKAFLEDMEDYASGSELLDATSALARLRNTRELIVEGLRQAPACLAEARRQALD